MGIKNIIQGQKCLICGDDISLLTSNRMYCDVCSHEYSRAEKNRIAIDRAKMEDEEELIEKRKKLKLKYTMVGKYEIGSYQFKCDKKSALRSHVIVKDEGNAIIGYYSHLSVLDKESIE